ncbi:MAG: HNH endonuclease [Terriglobia bacterium]
MKCRDNWRSENESGENSRGWRGGWENYYGPNWKRQKREARKRDNYTCQKCGLTEAELGKALDVHHKKPFKEFGYLIGANTNYKQANHLNNLVSLCPSCHKESEPSSDAVQMPLFEMSILEIVRSMKRNKLWKRCSSCEKTKPIEEFHKSKQWVDGHHAHCKQCRREYGSSERVKEMRRNNRRRVT